MMYVESCIISSVAACNALTAKVVYGFAAFGVTGFLLILVVTLSANTSASSIEFIWVSLTA